MSKRPDMRTMQMQDTIDRQAKLIKKFRAVLVEYLEWQPATASDRYIFEQKFKKLVNDTSPTAGAGKGAVAG